MITCGNRECGGSEVKTLSDYGCVHMLIGTMLAGQTRTMARRYQFVCAASWPLKIAIQNLFLLENISVVIPFPQSCPFPWGIWTPSNTWFPGPTRVLNPNGISIGLAVFAGSLVCVTD